MGKEKDKKPLFGGIFQKFFKPSAKAEAKKKKEHLDVFSNLKCLIKNPQIMHVIIPAIIIKTDLISHAKETAVSNARFRVINTLFIASRL